jgi:hypothetical protein
VSFRFTIRVIATKLEFRLEPGTHIDDEYAKAGIQDPKIIITTSRDPSSRLLQFSKVSRSSSLSYLWNSYLIHPGNASGIS